MTKQGKALLVAWLFLALAGAAAAQRGKGETRLRTVHGSVVDHSENPVANGVVYLRNLKTRGVRTYISDESGRYRFSGLDPNVDYEIHAEHGDRSSPRRTISSLDDRKDIEIILKLGRKKSSH